MLQHITHILRTTRRSLRRVILGKGQAALALVVFHLPSSADSAKALSERIAAHIRPLDIEVVVITQLIQEIDPDRVDEVMRSVMSSRLRPDLAWLTDASAPFLRGIISGACCTQRATPEEGGGTILPAREEERLQMRFWTTFSNMGCVVGQSGRQPPTW
ncbi:hypothetical protein FRC10_001801 [Ceratobasidium sp. 414]|nr:hypothetical protein FRC10_001801 [Ceratobasidium sp. 414]